MKGAPPRLPGGSGIPASACPGCDHLLEPVRGVPVTALRCAGCRGLWVDRVTFDRLCAAPPPGEAGPQGRAGGGGASGRVSITPPGMARARRCPTCGDAMNRARIGRLSGAAADVCRPHGAFFDARELARVRAFLAGGGAGRRPASGAFAAEQERLLLLARRHAARLDGSDTADPLSLFALLLP